MTDLRPPGPEPAAPERKDGTLADDPASSFDALYRTSHATMTRLAWLLVGSRAVAEELVHDAFLAIHGRWAAIDNPGGYLRRTVVNNATRWRQRQDRERHALTTLGEPPPTGDPVVDEMWDAVGRLAPEKRAVVVLRYWADLPHGEIADLLDCPVNTVRSRLHRALAELRKETDR